MKLLNYFYLLPFLFGLFHGSESSVDDIEISPTLISSSCDTTLAFFQKKLEITPGFEADKLYAVNADSIRLGNVGVMESNEKGFLFELFIRETPRGPLQPINIHKAALVQSDFDGNILWCKFYSRPNDRIGTLEGIQLIDSSIYITLQPSYGSHTALGFASGRGFIAKLDLEGNIQQQYKLQGVDGRPGQKNYPILEKDRSGGFMLASSGFYDKDTVGIVVSKLNGKDFPESCILDTTDIQVESFDEFTLDTFSYDWQSYISNFDTLDIFVADINFHSEDLCPPPLLPDAIIANLREMENCPSGTKVIVDIYVMLDKKYWNKAYQ